MSEPFEVVERYTPCELGAKYDWSDMPIRAIRHSKQCNRVWYQPPPTTYILPYEYGKRLPSFIYNKYDILFLKVWELKQIIPRIDDLYCGKNWWVKLVEDLGDG